MTEIVLPDIPSFCKTRDDVLMLFAPRNCANTEEALESGAFNLKRRIIKSVINEQKLSSVPTEKLSHAAQWKLFVQYLFQVQILSDAFDDAINHRLATILLDMKVDEYINTAPGIKRQLEQPASQPKLPRQARFPRQSKLNRNVVYGPITHPAGHNHRHNLIRHFYNKPAPQPQKKADPEKPVIADQYLLNTYFLRIIGRTL